MQTTAAFDALIYLLTTQMHYAHRSTRSTATRRVSPLYAQKMRKKRKKKNEQGISLIQERVHFHFKANLLSHCVCSSSFIRLALSFMYLRARVHSPVPTESPREYNKRSTQFSANTIKAFFILSLLILAPNTFDTLRSTNFFTGNISFCFIFAACDARA